MKLSNLVVADPLLTGYYSAPRRLCLTTPSTSTVTVNGVAAYRFVDYYQKLVGWTNASAARFEDTEIDIDPGDDELRKVFIPKTPEAYTYDADGNLTQDGPWNYTLTLDRAASQRGTAAPHRLRLLHASTTNGATTSGAGITATNASVKPL